MSNSPRLYIQIFCDIKNFTLPEKEDFYSHLNMEDITDADYTHEKGVWSKTKYLKILKSKI